MSTVPVYDRPAALRRAVFLERASIVWMVVEGAVAVAAGIAAHSLALAAFGWDSLIEMITAAAVLWRVQAEVRAAAVEAAERLATRVVAVGLLALALYILVEGIRDLRERHTVSPGVWGLAVSAVAAVGMPLLYLAKRRVAELLDSDALREDAAGNLACGFMAAIVLAGLIPQRWDLWWTDAAAALILGLLVAREGWEAWGRAGEPSPARAVRVYLALGSNLGDRAGMLRQARALLDAPDLRIVAASRVYETPPWGDVDQPRFLNQVVEVRTTLTPREVLERCRDVEARLGRVRSAKWGPRTIDVDILLYGTLQISEPDLTIPHPEMPRRAFALVPLAELDPGLRLPGGSTVRALLEALPDRAEVREYGQDPAAPAGIDRQAGSRGD